MKACVKTVGNKPVLFIDDKIVSPIIYASSSHILPMRTSTDLSQRNIRYFAEQGIDIVEVEANLSPYWRKNGDFSIMPIYAEVAHVVEANPNAKVILRLHLQPPYWWLRDNPNELCVWGGNETIDNGEPPLLICETGELTLHESFASEKWINDTSKILSLLCEELRKCDLAEHIIGIHIGSGVYSEWHQYGFWANPDYSPCMVKRFRRFLREKYLTETALNKAWGTTGVTFENAEIPAWERRFPKTESYFRNSIKDRDVADSLECLQLTAPEAIITFCKIIKEKWPEVLTGAFYGYFFGTFGIIAATAGHLAIDYIFNNEKYIDFLCAPLCYYENRKTNGTFFPRGILESQRLNNILWLTEMDSAPYEVGIWQNGTTVKDDSENVEEKSTFALKRNILGNLTRGHGAWYFDHRIFDNPVKTNYLKDAGWWEKYRYRNDIGKIQKIYNTYYPMSYDDQTDVLLVYDTKIYYEMTRSVFSEETLEPKMNAAISRTNVNFREIYLEDIKKVNPLQYKCVIFINTYILEDDRRKMVEKFVTETNADIVWMYAPGYLNGKEESVEFMKSLTGFDFMRKTSISDIIYKIDGKTKAIKTEEVLRECFAITSKCNSVGTYDDGSVCAGYVEKNGRNIWYLPYYIVPTELFAEIFDRAMAHRYTRNNDLYVMSGNHVTVVCSEKGGKDEIVLNNGLKVLIDVSPYTVVTIDNDTGKIIDE